VAVFLLLPGTLSDAEVREGITAFGLQVSSEDLDMLSLYMKDRGIDGELTLSMFMDLVHASEMEIPPPSERSSGSDTPHPIEFRSVWSYGSS
jgi:hypothetical protein